ncbi:MAG: hypothetical protein JKY37_04325 [Nannocystaceae bacterium]|nr:hypothetical protein [Nannocystaceae bacterium]
MLDSDATVDMVCDNLAGSAGFAGDWMAWLSNSNLDAGQRIPGWSNPYVLPDGTRVADGFSVLATYISIDAIYLAHAIDMTEAGDYPDPGTACPGSGGIPVWTSTDTLGRWDGYGTCADWTSDEIFAESADEVNLGDASETNSFWTVFWCDDYDCSHTASLYCIQINDN